MRVLVAGAAGVIGGPLAGVLTAAGHEVTALTRSEGRQEQLRGTGAELVTCDALDAAALGKAVGLARPEVVVNQLTALPRRISPRRAGRDLAATSRLRSEGTRNLMAAAAAAGAAHVVAQSVAFAYAPGGGPGRPGGRLRCEADPLYRAAPGPFAEAVAAIADLERETLGTAGIRGAVLRYGFFYGPGTSYAAGGSIAADVRRRRFPVVGDGAGVFCFIHVEDAAPRPRSPRSSSGPGACTTSSTRNRQRRPTGCPLTPRSSAPRPRDGCRCGWAGCWAGRTRCI